MEAHVDVTVIDRHNYHLSALDRPGLGVAGAMDKLAQATVYDGGLRRPEGTAVCKQFSC